MTLCCFKDMAIHGMFTNIRLHTINSPWRALRRDSWKHEYQCTIGLCYRISPVEYSQTESWHVISIRFSLFLYTKLCITWSHYHAWMVCVHSYGLCRYSKTLSVLKYDDKTVIMIMRCYCFFSKQQCFYMLNLKTEMLFAILFCTIITNQYMFLLI